MAGGEVPGGGQSPFGNSAEGQSPLGGSKVLWLPGSASREETSVMTQGKKQRSWERFVNHVAVEEGPDCGTHCDSVLRAQTPRVQIPAVPLTCMGVF